MGFMLRRASGWSGMGASLVERRAPARPSLSTLATAVVAPKSRAGARRSAALPSPDPRGDAADDDAEQHRQEAVDEAVAAGEVEQRGVHAAAHEGERLLRHADDMT